MELPEVIIKEIESYLPICTKCRCVTWKCPANCTMCGKTHCHHCLAHIAIKYYEGNFDICTRCIFINNYSLKAAL